MWQQPRCATLGSRSEQVDVDEIGNSILTLVEKLCKRRWGKESYTCSYSISLSVRICISSLLV
jgi:hypothetical protein